MAELFECRVEELVEYVPADKNETPSGNTKEFSLEDVRELRKRWGTAEKTTTRKLKGKSPNVPVLERGDYKA